MEQTTGKNLQMSMGIYEYEAFCSEHVSKEAFLTSVDKVLSNVTCNYITTIADIVSVAADMNSKPYAFSTNANLKRVNSLDEQNKDLNISRILQFKTCETNPSRGERKALLCINCCMTLIGCPYVKMEFFVVRLGITSR